MLVSFVYAVVAIALVLARTADAATRVEHIELQLLTALPLGVCLGGLAIRLEVPPAGRALVLFAGAHDGLNLESGTARPLPAIIPRVIRRAGVYPGRRRWYDDLPAP